MSYQRCPICKGTGISPHGLTVMESCRTCNGHGIISELTGLPPGGMTGPVKKKNDKDSAQDFEIQSSLG